MHEVFIEPGEDGRIESDMSSIPEEAEAQQLSPTTLDQTDNAQYHTQDTEAPVRVGFI